MKSNSIWSLLGTAALALAAAVSPRTGQAAAILYDQTITTGAIANPNVNSFTNCLAAEGCLGKAGLVDVAGGNLPDTIPYTFTFTTGQTAAVTHAANLVGTFTVVASRDIGGKAGATPDAIDTIAVTADGTALGTLYQNTIDTCPAGERGTAYPDTLVCGPNFHTDVTASDSLSIVTSLIRTLAADGSINFVLDPEDSVGRLKIFSVRLQIANVPEPGSTALLVLGLVLLAFVRRTVKVSPPLPPAA